MYFFFQAEDGIRDKLVTGVQTCALPISEGMRNDGYSDQQIADAGFAAGVNDLVSTNWQSLVYRTAPVRDANMGLTGGAGRVRYYVSGSYFGQDGVLLASAYNRASGRANIDIDATDRLSIKASLGLAREINYRVVSDNTISGIGPNAI